MNFLARFGFGKKKLRIVINKRMYKTRYYPRFWDVLQVGMTKAGYKLVYDLDHPADAVLIMHGARSKMPKIKKLQEQGAKLIQRLDGLSGTEEISVRDHPRNEGIYESHAIADAVIYQSEYCKWGAEVHLSPTKPDCKKFIVFNGADENIFSAQGPAHDKFGYEHMLVWTARWRAWKGLDQTIETFLKLGREDTVLAVVGSEIENPVQHPRIKYLGYLPHKDMARIYRASDVFVYFPWYDWCPNAVVEAITCGVPVVCSSKGGTKELIGPSGIVIPSEPLDDVKYFFRPARVNIEQAVQAVHEVLTHREKYVHPRPELTLSHAVSEYLRVIHEVTGIAPEDK